MLPRATASRRLLLALALVATAALAALVPATVEDFLLPGTQTGDVPVGTLSHSSDCRGCHGDYDPANEPWATWSGSLMALAGRDPLFFAQLTNANQDVAHVGTYCLRCHVPMAIVTGHAADPWGNSLDETDLDGVTCHFCHSLVDPVYVPGTSPIEDEGVLAALAAVPEQYGNAMFVLDPEGRRRGPYTDTAAPHFTIASPFHRRSELCGTCHDVGNVAVSRQPNGSYRYNALGESAPDADPWTQFPLERTYTEWKLSDFAAGGVDLGGRFGGATGPVVSTCQDCHMPRTTASGCIWAGERSDLARHEFAGAAAPVLDLILAQYGGEPPFDPAPVVAARAAAVSMLERAATLALDEDDGGLAVRVVNWTGHKLPTGHIEGRRIWLHVLFLDAAGTPVGEHGAYDEGEAELDEESTTVFEMKVGLSARAAAATGLPKGVTGHMALADTIVEDDRIPPIGFVNAAFEAGGAPVVGATYADGQHWSDSRFPIPEGAVEARVELYYQSLPRHYIEELRDGNVTDDRGETLFALWEATGRGAPIRMARAARPLGVETIFVDGFESGYTTAWSGVAP